MANNEAIARVAICLGLGFAKVGYEAEGNSVDVEIDLDISCERQS